MCDVLRLSADRIPFRLWTLSQMYFCIALAYLTQSRCSHGFQRTVCDVLYYPRIYVSSSFSSLRYIEDLFDWY